MTRRPPVQKACQRCRIKRAKCDGKARCSRCRAAGEHCEYDSAEKITKNDLRAEISRLEKIIRDGGIDIDLNRNNASGHLTSDDSHSSVASPLQPADGDEMKIDSVAGLLTPTPSSSTSRFATTPASRQSQQPSNEASSFNQLLSWRTCQPNINPHVALKKRTGIHKAALYLPPLPPETVSPSSHLDTWTTTGWTKAYVRHMFDAVATWDYMACSVLYRDAFLRDYYAGSPRFCSASLVHSILALANLLIHGDDNTIQASPSSASVSRALYQEANSAVLTVKAATSLPDIQSLGIMALYQLRGGQEEEAHRLARQFYDLVSEFCERKPTSEELGDEYFARARASTYCGAVSLVRMISMATGQIFNVPLDAIRNNPIALDSMFEDSKNSQLRTTFVTADEPYDPKVVAAKIFQLVEWAHALIISTRMAATPSIADAKQTYAKFLDWYTNFFSLLSAESSRTPFILFAHICYHYSLMCAFRPFIGIETTNSDFRATDLCSQAAQSILALVQSYDDMFTLQRVSGMLPYFILSAGLYGLAVEDSGSHLEPAYVLLREQVPAMMQVKDGGQEFVPNHQGSPANSSYVQVSMVDHARFLLQKISSTHLVAKLAIWKLKDS